MGTPLPHVTGPVAGGKGTPTIMATTFDLGPLGYVQEEFLVSGEAAAFDVVGAARDDGAWEAEPVSSAPFRTRVVVNRPADMARFDGSVVVEWLNVSIGADAGGGWTMMHNELIRRGGAWVG